LSLSYLQDECFHCSKAATALISLAGDLHERAAFGNANVNKGFP